MKRKILGKSKPSVPNKRAPEASVQTRKYAPTILAPMDREESAAATRLALDLVLRDGTVHRDRVRIYGPSLRIEKPTQRNGPPRRLIWVGIRDREKGVVHSVSLEGEKVTERLLDEAANPPFSDE